MKSSVQQYVSIFLVVCLFVFFGVGIASDGFTDFEIFKPIPVVSPTATAEVEDCSLAVVQSDTIDRITWENERVEYEFKLVSGDINSDAGFSISVEGIFSLNNENYYIELAESGRYQSIYLRMRGGWGSPSIPLEEVSDVKSFNLVREICKRNIRANKYFDTESDIPTWTIELCADSTSGNTIRLGDVSYSVSFNFLDRVSVTDARFVTPVVEDGYVFDGWYSNSDFVVENYIGGVLPSKNSGKFFYYVDVLPVARIEPAVTVTFVSGETPKTLLCAVGTTLPTINSFSSEKVMEEVNVLPDGYFYVTETGNVLRKGGTTSLVINQDIILTLAVDKTFVTLSFYNDGDLFYECDFELNTYLYLETIPVPTKPGYEFIGWHYVSDGSLFTGGTLRENASLSAKFVRKNYTFTYVLTEGFSFTDGTTVKPVSGYYCDISAVPLHCELSNSDGVLYRAKWVREDGTEYDFSQPVYSDVTLYSKWVRVTYKVSYYNYPETSSYYSAMKTVTYYPGEVVNYERDTAEYQKPGYILTLFVHSYYASEEHTEYDYSPLSDNVYLDVCYEIINYTINFYRDLDKPFKSVTLTCEDNITLPYLAFIPGYDFLGWFYQDGSPFDENAVILSDLNLYAKWQIQRKTVSLVAGGEVQDTFEVDYGTSLNDVLKQINYKNYNVVSFSADGFTDENCFIDDVSFVVASMDKQDRLVNTVKNKWQLIVGVVAGVLLLVIIVSVVTKSMKKYWRVKK